MPGISYSIDVSKAYRESGYDELPSDDEIKDVMIEAGEAGVDEAQGRARVDTGFMRDNVDFSVNGTILNFECDVDYASYNEDGTYKMEAQEFMGPGMDRILDVLNSRLGDKVSIESSKG